VSESAGRVAPRPASDDRGGPDEPPPILGSWRGLYALVVLELLAVIAALYWLTRRFD
jgi:hypothetical protein